MTVGPTSPRWTARYVGLRFRPHGRDRNGVDCWGLHRLVLADECAIAVPSYADAYVSLAEAAEIAAVLDGQRAAEPWLPVEPGRERMFDMAVFRDGTIAGHVATVVVPGEMLHVSAHHPARVEPYNTGEWQPRFLGFHRHRLLAASGGSR
ncbi:NlpC/P60 family protein [Aurantimonas sp. 22II-16-19i]|uniref:NlpC/P60 family protein n=1 Tax=Aurantimonas sp. 22II-16-19i TaxID=1317114 RepID=UPI0009F7B72C|nr:NlpC/P60 family protein [Aurantimonas sp. 22II-16-19i]ORE87827.1 NLP/P60 protein [Aurantimonas sp. 22II-16-19i]